MQLKSVTTIDTTNCDNYLELRTFDVTGTTTAKAYTKYAYPIIPNLSNIINVNSLPETVTVDESTADTKIKVTKNYRCWKLPPYGSKDDDIQQALALIGCKLVIYNNVGSYKIDLYGRFFKAGETDFKAKLTLAKGLVALTMCVGTDGQFYWQYDGAIAELKVDESKFTGTLKPGTGFQYKVEIDYPPIIRPNN